MAIFGKKKPQKKNNNNFPTSQQNGDFYDRVFKQKDENNRKHQEQLKDGTADSISEKHPGFVSEFDDALSSVPMEERKQDKGFENAVKDVLSEENESYAVTDVIAAAARMPVSELCDIRVGMSATIGKRDSQQDAANYSDVEKLNNSSGKWLAVLCDGMGGMNGGEKASALSVEMMMNEFSQINDMEIPAFYRKALIDLDDAVYGLKDEYGNLLGAGSTLISVIIENNDLYWATVGDSHIYIIRGDEMIRVNKEHNYFEDLKVMVNRGYISMEEALNDPNREALTSYIGIGSLHLMEVIEKPFKLEKNDFIILCSDGLYRSVTDDEIYKTIVEYSDNMQTAANKLIECALSKNKKYQDNTTVITIRY